MHLTIGQLNNSIHLLHHKWFFRIIIDIYEKIHKYLMKIKIRAVINIGFLHIDAI